MKEQEFLEKQGPHFFLRLYRYWYLSTTEYERRNQKNNDIIFAEFEEGRYSIRFLDLKERADQDVVELKQNNVTFKGTGSDYKLQLPPLKIIK